MIVDPGGIDIPDCRLSAINPGGTDIPVCRLQVVNDQRLKLGIIKETGEK